MAYVKVPAPSVVYHLAKADRLDSILDDGQIRRFEDSECWFCESLPNSVGHPHCGRIRTRTH